MNRYNSPLNRDQVVNELAQAKPWCTFEREKKYLSHPNREAKVKMLSKDHKV